MILDYAFDKTKRVLSISYVKENGMKDIMNFNVDRFKTYYYNSNGKYVNWNGKNCDIKWTETPDKFDIKTYMEELNEDYKAKLQGKSYPKLYTWDIEVVADEFPEPSVAKYPVSTISICSPECNVIILGTKPLNTGGDEYLKTSFQQYIDKLDYFKTTNLKMPSIKYVRFNTEKDMLIYFLENIVAKVPVLGGWNSMLFDWQYIQNRIKGFYPDIKLSKSSCNNSMDYKNYTDIVGNKVKLSIPHHTVMLDMMDIIETFDYVILPQKESMSLDYIAYESLGVNKIEYDGDLEDLYYQDYNKYVFYNAIDSVLVQLIDKRFKTLQNIYTQALYCREKIGAAFGKIAISEALVFNYFYDNGIKVIPERKKDVERGTLVGAYVRTPTPGKHNYVCCNDFASLYPSTIISCNLSFENLVGEFYDEDTLRPYKEDYKNYIVVGGNVHKNEGTIEKPKLGELITRCLDEKYLDEYRENPRYFVSVNGHVYDNDKDYAFKVIQATLKANRNTFKYLAKSLEADVMSDVEHLLKGHTVKHKNYSKEQIKVLTDMGYSITCTGDLESVDLKEFAPKLKTEIEFYVSYEQAMKLLGNSMYGGSSHQSFFWFNMSLANDITGEAKNIIKLMEEHIPEYIKTEWPYMTDVHKELGITVDPDKAYKMLETTGQKSFVDVIYGDSCDGKTLISTNNGDIQIKDLFDNSNIVFVDRDKEFALSDVIIKNYNGNEIINSNIKYIIRHKTKKSKWEITDSHNNSVIVTGDHSMIIWDGEMKEIKPSEMSIGMKLITINGFTEVVSIKNIGNFENEYVYDIEVKTNNENEHNFFGGNILIHNTDSVKGDTIIHTENGDKTIEEMFNENYNNNLFHTHKGHELVSTSDKVLNYNNNNELEYGKVNYIMRHKVTKPKWKLKTKSGKEIFVTNDHSMIVFRNGKKLEVKPYEIQPTDKILVIK